MTMPPPPPYGNWPPPGSPWPYPGQPPGRAPGSAGIVFGLAVVGTFAYFSINLVVGLIVLMLGMESSTSTAVVVTGAVVLFVIAFGGGGLLMALRKPWTKGLGLGLMIGWALTSIVTVGICTGVNPSMYSGL